MRMADVKDHVLKRKPYSDHPDDAFLETVLVHLPDNEITPYVAWMYNKNDDAFYYGDYCRTLEDGLEAFNKKEFKSGYKKSA